MPRNPGNPTIQEVRSSQTHCINGHKFTEENTYMVRRGKGKPNGYRMCRECHRIREHNRRIKKQNGN